MYFTAATIVYALVATSLASPIQPSKVQAKRALQSQSYAQFQVSDGVAGNALAEVNAKFPIDTNNLASVSASDLAIIKAARVTAEDAETGTGGFNDQLAAASGDSKTTLQNGKIKNKVLKLQLEVLGLMIDAAQGKSNQAALDAETKKLNTNIALDKKAAGQASVGVTKTFKGN